jgi:ribosome-binding factor A
MSKPSYPRIERVKELLKEVIGEIIQKEIKDKDIGFVTITDAEVSNDLKNAKIFFSVLGKEEEKKEALTILNNSSRFIRKKMSKRIQLKFIPNIKFILDDTPERVERITKILNEINKSI